MKLIHDIAAARTLALIFAVGLLAACSDTGASDGTAHATVAEAEAETARSHEPQRIAFGEQVDLADYVVPGEYTVFDFTSKYCPPCQQIAPWMDRLHAERDGVQVVLVDINRPGVRGIDFQSPVARQYGTNSIPHFKVFDAEGKLVAEGDPAWELVVSWLMELPQKGSSGQS